ncbi:MAG: DUF1156 domain-containing protein [Bacteroidetes bacterium]|nr:DUF1156 domain-containing protein [Bacteroidota bacterium]
MKRLIEVALPIREISAESVRDKSLRHGHISTLHLWWARRPLAASRAIVFASLVPDPDDTDCPQAFKDKVQELLGNNPKYKPYNNQPDTLRNRLLSFIAKWSQKKIDFDEGKSSDNPDTKEMLDDNSLVKWESSINPAILKIARDLIQSAYGYTPTVLDPFAGGGAIPLEAVRLGCNVIANDYNPVAHIIERCTFEFPYKYGRPGEVEISFDEAKRMGIYEKIFSETEMNIVSEPKLNYGEMNPGENWFELNYCKTRLISTADNKIKLEVTNKLVFDVGRHAKNILERVKQKIGHLYPPGKDGNPVVGYLWARTAPCSNPSCKKEIPLLRSLMVCDKPNKKVALTLNIKNDEIIFGIARDKEIKFKEGTTITKGARCPFCKEITPTTEIKRSSFEGKLLEKMTCVITDTLHGKDYRPAEASDLIAFEESKNFIKSEFIPNEQMQEIPDLVSGRGWNFKTWATLFNPRQSSFLSVMIETVKEDFSIILSDDYWLSVISYLSLWLNKISMNMTNMAIYHITGEKFSVPFTRQAIPMVWDYPEANPFSGLTGSVESQLYWILRVIEHEKFANSDFNNNIKCYLGDAALITGKSNSVDIVMTDPPYFDAIAYADLSDFFYVWFKRTLADIYPEVFSTPMTPKSEEATALKHRNNGSVEEANNHFELKLAQSLTEAKRLCKDDGVISIMFAHQSTHAWSALINAIFKAGLNVTATYPIDTELTTALKANMAALSSSVTVVCRHRVYGNATTYSKVKIEIEKVVRESVDRFWGYGFRGADLIVACYGPAVGVIGQYEYVEKQGEPISISDLLKDVREIALKAIAGAFTGDVHSKFYFVVANMYSTTEIDWDDIVKIAQIGSGEEDARIFSDQYHYIIREDNKARLALLKDREDFIPAWDKLPLDATLIDQLHSAMYLWKNQQRGNLIQLLKNNQLIENDPLWKLAQSLFEVLPKEVDDKKIISALLSERETLKVETRREIIKEEQSKDKTLFDN